MRLATFNIHGRFPGENRVDPDRLAHSIRTLAPDILALQEVDLDRPATRHADLAAVVAEAMECVDHRFVAALTSTPRARWVEARDGTPLTGPAFGNALFSRYPVRSWEVLRMPGAGPHITLPIPGDRRAAVIGEEPRVALIADIETPHGVVRVASTHLSFLPGFNLGQLRRLTRHLAHGTPPGLIMGDLNLPGGIPAAITGYRPLARHRTYPAVHPLVQLDHLLLKGELGPVRHTAALRLPVSDHRALLADIADD
jgi:endonuclease/exonuclease/phosphatase family metal-dependent hydrolase